LLDIAGKTKDGLNARKGLQVLRIREELYPQQRPNRKVYLPPASYTLTNEEKTAICKCPFILFFPFENIYTNLSDNI
jgi:hypothetical protein